ncbi:hypothetical protein ABHQ57_15000 [Tenacibaculum sp. ZH5_bin.1]|uniref:hypothetical protein n=1 Tax=Tenacibaculum TaxID=104267 RepID=UPI001430E058|nr:hypothetical protein [Tenacibaculum mesophilum]KAF9658281.1 hypothetical protein HBA12_13900 [Tenacibaculum mesophilum]
MKDIFIDNNIAKNFVNPADENYKELIKWLLEYNNDKDNDAYLVTSNLLLKEYLSSSRDCSKSTSIPVIISTMTAQGRLLKFSNQNIKEFITENFTKKIHKSLRSNEQDHTHIATILMSERKYAISIDENFNQDLKDFPGQEVTVVKRPEELDYK